KPAAAVELHYRCGNVVEVTRGTYHDFAKRLRILNLGASFQQQLAGDVCDWDRTLESANGPRINNGSLSRLRQGPCGRKAREIDVLDNGAGLDRNDCGIGGIWRAGEIRWNVDRSRDHVVTSRRYILETIAAFIIGLPHTNPLRCRCGAGLRNCHHGHADSTRNCTVHGSNLPGHYSGKLRQSGGFWNWRCLDCGPSS